MGARSGHTYPLLTCNECGETKKALHFVKRYGPYYDHLKALDPKKYSKKCKRCSVPLKPGQTRDDIPEPKYTPNKVGGYAKGKKERAKKRELAKKERLSRNEHKQKVRRETRIKSMEYLAKRGCAECGTRDPRVLEYDHKNPEDKKRNVGRLIIDGFSWSSPTLRREIRKCRVLCSNCHRRHTIEQQGYYAHEEVQKKLGELSARHKFDL